MHPDRASTKSQRYLARRRTCRKARWQSKVGKKQDSVERTMSKLRSYPIEVLERIDSRPQRPTQLHASGKQLREAHRICWRRSVPAGEVLESALAERSLEPAGDAFSGGHAFSRKITRRWSLPPFWPSAWAFSTYLRKSGRKNQILRGA